MSFLNRINPFKKKSIRFFGDLQPIETRSLFQGFGFTSHVFKNLYLTSQNNFLLTKYFNEIAEVAAPVLKYSDSANQVGFKCNIPEVEKLLNAPNHYQSWDDFISLAILYKRLYGNVIINGFSTLGADNTTKPRNLYLLSPQFISLKIDENKDWRINRILGYIYDTNEGNRAILDIKPEEILHLKEVNPNFYNNQYFFGESRYCGCYKNIEAISNSYDTKVNLYKNGPRLIITGKTQGEFASANTQEKIADVQEAMKKYGMRGTDYNNLITDVPLDVFNASLNVQQLQINENNAADFQKLCDVQNMDSKIFSDNQGATFSNKEAAIDEFYNNGFVSEMKGTFEDLQEWLKAWWPTLELQPDYSNISAIVKANIKEYQRLLEDCKLGLMTRNEYNLAIGKDEVSDPSFNEYRVFIPNRGWVLESDLQNNNQQNGTQNIQVNS